jgi:hypothetical protein
MGEVAVALSVSCSVRPQGQFFQTFYMALPGKKDLNAPGPNGPVCYLALATYLISLFRLHPHFLVTREQAYFTSQIRYL